MELGVCYYPEQWPVSWWEDDARAMQELGIRWVRIAEFAWSVIEPEPGRLQWDWLDRAIDTLHRHGLKVVLGTPTATPPKWLVDAHPDILAVDADGRPRGFGSRRHYCFSSPVWREQTRRIVDAMAERYGRHPAVAAWQTDNEYGCHDTVLSYSPAARLAFRSWLEQHHAGIEALNAAWGTVFWSQHYRSFAEIDPPVGAVTETHPAHRLDYRRFCSDQVASYNRMQVDSIRRHSPGRPVAHNFMGFFTEFDHHVLASDLDIASWDSYPLGFTQDRAGLDEDSKRRWLRTGHPDIPAFHHDLYRGMCQGRWWVMEQQPGPVNWAPWNPAPADGMVRLWTWQAFAHGAEVVSYFRWRQVPYGQEQMHAGLQRPDRVLDQGGHEAATVARELQTLAAAMSDAAPRVHARVAVVFDYPSHWMGSIQPQGADYSALHETFQAYAAARSLGLDVDVVGSGAALDAYALVVLPAVLHVGPTLAERLAHCPAQLVAGPRLASKDGQLGISSPLPPGTLADLFGVRVTRVESLPPGIDEALTDAAPALRLLRWRERLELSPAAQAGARFADGSAALVRCGRARYLAGCADESGWRVVLEQAAADAGLETEPLPLGLRISALGELRIACNFSAAAVAWRPAQRATLLLGSEQVASCDVAIWKVEAR